MADTKISSMAAASFPLTGAELVPLVQGGVNVQTPMAAVGGMVSYLSADYTSTSTPTAVMSVSMVPGTYIVNMNGYATSTGANHKFGFTIGAGTLTTFIANLGFYPNTAPQPFSINGAGNSISATGTGTFSSSIYMVVSVAGTFSFLYAQNTGGSPSVLSRGTNMIAMRVA